MARPQGPNVKKLITRFFSIEAIPKNTKNPLMAGLRTLSNKEKLTKAVREATRKTFQSIDAVKMSRDNPYGNSDEKIAEAILEKIEQQKKQKQSK